MRRPSDRLAIFAALLGIMSLACEELPAGQAGPRVWPERPTADSEPAPAPDAEPIERVDDAGPPDATSPDLEVDAEVDAEPPVSICARDDADGDGFGTHPTCPRPDCDDDNRAIHPGAIEACNGLDDDCDEVIDEGLFTRACGLGACRREVPNCVDGSPTRCAPGAPTDELCNGVDDDCDGVLDEGAGRTRCGVGACERVAECVAGVEAMCMPGPGGDEACNRVDDDCDGQTDEGFLAEVVGSSYSVLTGLHGPCDGNQQRIGPDCNAAMNRFCAGRACGVSGFGPVENSGDIAVVTCLGGVQPEPVSFAELAAQHGPCDGARQRIGPDCNAAIHRWCASTGRVSGFGPVESGADDVQVVCVGARGAVHEVPYAALAQQHWPCDGNRQRIGPDCNAAIHRWCASQGFVSGYGPVENFGGTAWVTCVRP